jgi:ketosteroid isomerase-like protein
VKLTGPYPMKPGREPALHEAQAARNTSCVVNARDEFELVSEAWAAFNRGDLETGLERLHPEIEIVPFGAALEGRSYTGREGVRHWLTEILSLTWERFETIPTDYRKAGDRLVVYGHWSARVRASGTEIEMPATWVIDIRDGLISRWETFTDRAEAHQSAGLG